MKLRRAQFADLLLANPRALAAAVHAAGDTGYCPFPHGDPRRGEFMSELKALEVENELYESQASQMAEDY